MREVCGVKGCQNGADPRWFVHFRSLYSTETKSAPACDGHGGLRVGVEDIRDEFLTPTPTPLRFGVYKKVEGKTGVGHLYQSLMLTRHHTTGAHFVVYIPLRIEPEWSGTIRPCILERELFEKKFEFVGEALP